MLFRFNPLLIFLLCILFCLHIISYLKINFKQVHFSKDFCVDSGLPSYLNWIVCPAVYPSLNLDVYVAHPNRSTHWISQQTLNGEAWKHRLKRIIYYQLAENPVSAFVPPPKSIGTDMRHLWFMKGGTVYPKKGQVSDIWPNADNPIDDRILAQLMYIPTNYKENNKSLKRIFLEGYHEEFEEPGRAYFIRAGCPVSTCSVVKSGTLKNETLQKQNETDYLDAYVSCQTSPKEASISTKVMIFNTLESPLVYSADESFSNTTWAATYKLDSELAAPYFKFVPYNYSILVQPQKRNFAAGKTDQVAWMVSNCAPNNDRNIIAKELADYGVNVTIWGSCGEQRCEDGMDCWKKIGEKFKFYLAFENAACNHYVTEKVGFALQHGVLPIVMGASPSFYRAAVPYGSIIHVDDFPDIKHLAEYIKLLDKNNTLYNSYFRWHGTGEFINTYLWCRVCALLHAPPNPNIRNIQKWWNPEGNCLEYESDDDGVGKKPNPLIYQNMSVI